MMQASDSGSRAFRHALTTALGPSALVGVIAASLFPLGVVPHLLGMVSWLCVTTAHITSDVAALSLVVLTGSAVIVGTLSVVASAWLQFRALGDWTPVAGAVRGRVERACREMEIRAPLLVFRHDEVFACSRGVIVPSIWISDSAVDALDDAQLAAVLTHEDHHCLRGDPAKRQLLEVLSRALFAFPVVREATIAFRRAAEFAADDAAATMTSTRTTAKALLRFAMSPEVPMVVAFGSGTTIGERVQRLVGSMPEHPVRDRHARTVSALTAVAALACVLLVALLPGM